MAKDRVRGYKLPATGWSTWNTLKGIGANKWSYITLASVKAAGAAADAYNTLGGFGNVTGNQIWHEYLGQLKSFRWDDGSQLLYGAATVGGLIIAKNHVIPLAKSLKAGITDGIARAKENYSFRAQQAMAENNAEVVQTQLATGKLERELARANH